jgi:hypothetical protein
MSETYRHGVHKHKHLNITDTGSKNVEYKEDTPQQGQGEGQQEVHIISREEAEEKRKVDSVLANEKLREILQDPDTKKVLELCGRPDMLGRYMKHDKWGPRLRLLGEHGLVKFEK